MRSKCLSLLSSFLKLVLAILDRFGLRQTFKRKWYPVCREYTLWIWDLVVPPYNIPLLAGLGFLALGLLLVMVSVKDPWYQVPVYLRNAPVVDQSDKLPTRRVPDKLEAVIQTSKFEYPCKALVVVSLTAAAVYIVRHRFEALPRAQALGTVAAVCMTIGLAFCHLVIVDDPEVSHLGAWMFMQHDGLSWYGGDTYTSREYEIHGGAWEVGIKDPPKFMAAITPPYVDFEIATLGGFSNLGRSLPCVLDFHGQGLGEHDDWGAC